MDRSCIHLLGMHVSPTWTKLRTASGQITLLTLVKSSNHRCDKKNSVGHPADTESSSATHSRGIGVRTFTSPWLENSSSTYFVRSCDVRYEVCLTVRATLYCSKSQLSWTLYRTWQMLCTQRNFLVTREISVVISWMDPTMVVANNAVERSSSSVS